MSTVVETVESSSPTPCRSNNPFYFFFLFTCDNFFSWKTSITGKWRKLKFAFALESGYLCGRCCVGKEAWLQQKINGKYPLPAQCAVQSITFLVFWCHCILSTIIWWQEKRNRGWGKERSREWCSSRWLSSHLPLEIQVICCGKPHRLLTYILRLHSDRPRLYPEFIQNGIESEQTKVLCFLFPSVMTMYAWGEPCYASWRVLIVK